jgi:uncharacterized membrane protein
VSFRERYIGLICCVGAAYCMGAGAFGPKWIYFIAAAFFMIAYCIAANHLLIKPIRAKHKAEQARIDAAMEQLRDADPARTHERIDPGAR